MSDTFNEFNELSKELFDEFSIGRDGGEQSVLTNPAKKHPVTGAIITPAETKGARCVRASLEKFQGTDNVQLGDIRLKFRTDELDGFVINTETTVALSGRKYSVVTMMPSGKDIMTEFQARSI